MLENIFGNQVIEKILLNLTVYGECYPRGIANLYNIPITSVVQQLKRLENGGVIASQIKGKIRLYQFNPRYPFTKELKALLQKALDVMPGQEIAKYYSMRTRPRRQGKP